jgi:hypothetical protein
MNVSLFKEEPNYECLESKRSFKRSLLEVVIIYVVAGRFVLSSSISHKTACTLTQADQYYGHELHNLEIGIPTEGRYIGDVLDKSAPTEGRDNLFMCITLFF